MHPGSACLLVCSLAGTIDFAPPIALTVATAPSEQMTLEIRVHEPRPLAAAADLLERQYGAVITY